MYLILTLFSVSKSGYNKKACPVCYNAMVVEADIPVNRMSALLFELEMKGVVKAMVGGVYHLLA